MTHAELIEALGGGTVISHQLSKVSGEIIDREAVYKWHKRNFIPWKWRVFLVAMAKERQVVPPNNFSRAASRDQSREERKQARCNSRGEAEGDRGRALSHVLAAPA